MRLELIQGPHAEELGTQGVRRNEWAFFDPRPRQASQTFVLAAEVLARFQPGPAQFPHQWRWQA